MEVGLCSLGDHRADPVTGVWTTQDERHAHIMEYLLAAEPLGFDTLVCGEHHFSGFIMSVPQIFLAWIAGQTERIRLATGVTLLPHHDPVRIAEDFATLDVVSGGRAEVWVGKGVEPYVYAHYGQDFKRATAMQREGLDLLTRLWTETDLTWTGQFRPPLNGVTLQPRPVQTPHPPIFIAAGSLASAEEAARLGVNLTVTGLSADLDSMPLMRDRYLEVWAACGHAHKPRITVLAHVHCAPTSQEAFDHLRQYQPPFQSWVISKKTGVTPEEVELPSRITNFGSPECVIACGSPQQVLDKICQIVELMGADRYIYQGDYGGQPWPKVMGSLERFSDRVLPQLKTLDLAA
ncbi:MAG: LLM class flavin-dependent oxidoreductase [Rhodospirillaceae bacterium]|nr:LLM class flavin-dependent oxidoreductase [Rhodospirillaceae bacterium]